MQRQGQAPGVGSVPQNTPLPPKAPNPGIANKLQGQVLGATGSRGRFCGATRAGAGSRNIFSEQPKWLLSAWVP